MASRPELCGLLRRQVALLIESRATPVMLHAIWTDGTEFEWRETAAA